MKLRQDNILEVSSNTNNRTRNIGVSINQQRKMISIFTQHLYSRPIDSICRELASNMQDASRAAGTLEIPNIVKIDEDDGGEYISFRDFGTGMDFKTIRNVYMNILESSKEDNNDDIGCFGLGSKTPMSYRKDYYLITTVPKKRKEFGEIVERMITYTYLIYEKVSGELEYDLFSINPDTEEKQGTEVKVYFKDDDGDKYSYKYKSEKEKFADSCLRELSFFDNIILDFRGDYRLEDSAREYNQGKIVDGEYFKYRTTSQYSSEMHLVIDKVSYKVDWKALNINPLNISVGVKFKIGELMVTPSREDIQYTDNIQELVIGSKDLIRKRIELVKQELIDYYNKDNQPIESLFDFIKARKRFAEEKSHNIRFIVDEIDENQEINPQYYPLNISDLKDKLNGIVFKPIQHLPIKLKDKILPYFFLNCRTTIIDGREKRTEVGLRDIYDKNLLNIVVYKEKDIHGKEFAKYIKNCYFVRVNKIIGSADYRNWKDLLGIDNIIQQNKQSKILKENERLSYLNDWDDRKIKIQGSVIGIAKIFSEYKRIILEELDKECNKFIGDFDNFEIPQSWRDEQKALKTVYIKKNKLEGIISRKDIINGGQGDLQLNTFNDYTGFIIYGFLKDNKQLEACKALLECFKSLRYEKVCTYDTNKKTGKYIYKKQLKDYLNTKAVNIFRIAVNNEKLILKITKPEIKYNHEGKEIIKQVPIAIHVDKFMEDNNRLISKILTGYEIEDKYSKLLNNDYALETIGALNKFVYQQLIQLKEYYEIFDADGISNFKNRYEEVYKQLIDNKESLKQVGVEIDDLSIRPTINYLDNYFKGVELLFTLDYRNLKDENLDKVADYLKTKGKKVTYTYYSNSNVVQQIQSTTKEEKSDFKWTGTFAFMNDLNIRKPLEVNDLREYDEDNYSKVDPNTLSFIIDVNDKQKEDIIAETDMLEQTIQEELIKQEVQLQI